MLMTSKTLPLKRSTSGKFGVKENYASIVLDGNIHLDIQMGLNVDLSWTQKGVYLDGYLVAIREGMNLNDKNMSIYSEASIAYWARMTAVACGATLAWNSIKYDLYRVYDCTITDVKSYLSLELVNSYVVKDKTSILKDGVSDDIDMITYYSELATKLYYISTDKNLLLRG